MTLQLPCASPLKHQTEASRPGRPPRAVRSRASQLKRVLLQRCVACALKLRPLRLRSRPDCDQHQRPLRRPSKRPTMTTAPPFTADNMWHACMKAELGGLSMCSPDRLGLTAVCRPLQDETLHFHIDPSHASFHDGLNCNATCSAKD